MLKITKQQFKAWYRVEGIGMTQTAAAVDMGVSQPRISQLLHAVESACPALFNDISIRPVNIISYCPTMDYDVKHRY